MTIPAWKRILIGPFLDLRRFVVGSLAAPPATRRTDPAAEAAARSLLADAGCDLAACSVTNLHTAVVDLPADRLHADFLAWRAWPLSAFFACPTLDAARVHRFAYRLYNGPPIVHMRLKSSVPARHIIYDLVWGIGVGGYHAFLFQPETSERTAVSILTTFPPHPFFFAGLHDRMNADIFHLLQENEPTP